MNERIEVRKRRRKGNVCKRKKIYNHFFLRQVESPIKAVLSEPQMAYERLQTEGG